MEQKTGLVLEGGGMRGIYTAGVLDLFMDQGVTFDGVIGVSAGASTAAAFFPDSAGGTSDIIKNTAGSSLYEH